MSLTDSSRFIRTVLLVDAATCLVTGLFLALCAGTVGDITQIPPGLSFYAGLGLLPVCAWIAFVALRLVTVRAAVWVVIAGNVAWVLGSIWLMVGNAIRPNALGYAFIAAQAFAVAVLAELEYRGLRRVGNVAAAAAA